MDLIDAACVARWLDAADETGYDPLIYVLRCALQQTARIPATAEQAARLTALQPGAQRRDLGFETEYPDIVPIRLQADVRRQMFAIAQRIVEQRSPPRAHVDTLPDGSTQVPVVQQKGQEVPG